MLLRMSDDHTQNLWKPHTVEETLDIYAGWAGSYEGDMADWGYATPGRVALALRKAGANPAKPVLDFGCGTGLSGLALKAAGFDVVDGTDISTEMLAEAEAKGAYRQTWIGEPGSMGPVGRGDYATIAATGVVSLGAAPPETLDMLLGALGPAGMLAFSYNDATLGDANYTGKLQEVLATGDYTKLVEDYGSHLPAKDMKSMVYVLQKT